MEETWFEPLATPSAPDRHRHHGHEWPVGQLVAVGEDPAQRTGADGQDDVVDRGPHGVLQPLHIVEPDGSKGDPTAPADGRVEGRAWRRQREGGLRCRRPGILALADASHVEDPQAGSHEVDGQLHRPDGTGHQRPEEQLQPGRHPLVGRCRLRSVTARRSRPRGRRAPTAGRRRTRRPRSSGASWRRARCARRPSPRRSTSPTGACCGRAAGRRCPRPGRRARGGRRDWARPPGGRGSRCRSRGRRPRPGARAGAGTSTSRRRNTGSHLMRAAMISWRRSNR